MSAVQEIPTGSVSKTQEYDIKKKNAFYRAWRHPYLMPYNRLAILVVLANLSVFLFNDFSSKVSPFQTSGDFILTMVILNFAIATVFRNQDFINLLFFVATSVPVSAPLWLRWACGKVYHFGGVHVGSYFSGVLWFLLLTIHGVLFPNTFLSAAMVNVAILHCLLFFVIIGVSLPHVRAKYHNLFEVVARFGNWISLAFFWAYFLSLTYSAYPLTEKTTFEIVFLNAHLYGLLLITFLTALPWLRLKKVPVSSESHSNHAVFLSFRYGVTPFEGSSTDLSLRPLFEWHSFANIPAPGVAGFRLTVSRAGDWTGRLIENTPKSIWVKGLPTAGVGHVEKLFKRVLWVATGSGIGPCAPHLLTGKVPAQLVWSTRNPWKTYGEDFVNEIQEAVPDAIFWDTSTSGKPDLVKLTLQAYSDFGAEAVIVIANKKVTWHVVYELESRGIPAFGAIWDS